MIRQALAKIFFELGIATKNTKNSHVCRNLNKQPKFNKSADNLKRPGNGLVQSSADGYFVNFSADKKSMPKV